MKQLASAFWVEALKARRSKVPFFTALGLSIAPLVGGLFMIILKDPQAAKSMGLISTKAQLVAGTAEWSTFFNMQAQAVAIGGMMIFSMITAWVFGREFSDRTAKDLLALPTSRETILTAKFFLIALWTSALTVFIFVLGLLVGYWVHIPGWSMGLFQSSMLDILGAGILTILLLPYVAWIASAGRGYLPAFGWMVLMVALAQVAAITGWGDVFPWSIPALFGGAVGPRGEMLGLRSYLILLGSSVVGLVGVYIWWRKADHTR